MHFINDYISYFFTVLFILFFSAPLKYNGLESSPELREPPKCRLVSPRSWFFEQSSYTVLAILAPICSILSRAKSKLEQPVEFCQFIYFGVVVDTVFQILHQFRSV
jgi:hypothetical protein